MLIWYFSNNLYIWYYVGKLPEQHFSVWLFSNPGDNILFLLKFNEARISEWNLDKESNIDKRETVIDKKEFFFKEMEEKVKSSVAKINQLEKLADEYKLKAQSKGRVLSEELKEKLRIYHANENKHELVKENRNAH